MSSGETDEGGGVCEGALGACEGGGGEGGQGAAVGGLQGRVNPFGVAGA